MISRAANIIAGARYIYLAKAATSILNVSTMLVLAIAMDPDQFGKFAYTWSVIQFSSALVSAGGPAYLLRECSFSLERNQGGLSRLGLISIIAIIPIAIAILLGFVVNSLSSSNLAVDQPVSLADTNLMWILISAVAINMLAGGSVLIRVKGNTATSMLIRDAGPQIVLLAVSGFLLIFEDLDYLNLIHASSIALGMVAIASFIYGALQYKPKDEVERFLPRYSISFWGSSLLSSLAMQVDMFIAGSLMQSSELAIYSVLRRLANLVGFSQVVANWSVSVQLAKSYTKGDLVGMQGIVRHGLVLSFLPGILIALFLLVVHQILFSFFEIEPSLTNIIALFIATTATLVNVSCGVNYMTASQCHLEGQAFFARGVSIIAIVVCASLQFYSSSILQMMIAVLMGSVCSNFYLNWMIGRRLGITCSVDCLWRKEGKI